MTDPYTFLMPVGIVVLLVIAFFIWKQAQKKKSLNARNRFIEQVLNDALQQKTSFDLKLLDSGVHMGLSTSLVVLDASGLIMRSDHPASSDWNKKPVEVYFRVTDGDEPVFYVFESEVLKIAPNSAGVDMTLAAPDHLRVEKKRHFERAHPDQADILMVAVWPVTPGRRLPRTTADLGNPAIRWKAGDKDTPVRVENISGSGIALRFAEASAGQLPVDARRGRSIICLVVYRREPSAAKPTVFWCTAEIMNSRSLDKSTALGLEFTNWAVQEQGDTEIHWTHNSPWRGVRPILEWVKRLEMAHN